jgi:hypothetical protein
MVNTFAKQGDTVLSKTTEIINLDVKEAVKDLTAFH